MKPTDFYIGYRHFFGYLLSGLIWLTSLSLSVGYYPGKLSGWFLIGSFFIASYIVGYCVHGPLFRLIIRLDDWWNKRNSKLEQRDSKHQQNLQAYVKQLIHTQAIHCAQPPALLAYLDSFDDKQREKFCKRYVLEYSSRLSEQLSDLEGTINLVGSLIPSLIVLAVGCGVYFGFHIEPRNIRIAIISPVFLILIAFWLFFIRLHEKRVGEKRVWLETFLILQMRPEKSLLPITDKNKKGSKH